MHIAQKEFIDLTKTPKITQYSFKMLKKTPQKHKNDKVSEKKKLTE